MNTHGPSNLKFFISRDEMWGDTLACRIGRRDMSTGQWSAVSTLTLVPIADGMMTPVALALKRDEAQALMDELWNVGIRPTAGAGSAGQLAAVQDHLKDLQRLVFDPPKK